LIDVKYFVNGVVFRSWKKPDDCWYEILQASSWSI